MKPCHINYKRTEAGVINATTTGAGILPFFVTEDGTVLFLLGKEQYVQHWRGSLRWSGFEGGRKGEESTEHNATREFIEETMGVFTTDATAVDLSEYAMKVTFSVNSTSQSRVHVTYVKQMRWDPTLETRFAKLREHLLSLRELSQRFAELKSYVPRRYPFFLEGDAVEKDRSRFIVQNVSAWAGNGSVHIRFKATMCNDADPGSSPRQLHGSVLVDASAHALAYLELLEVRSVLANRLVSPPSGYPRHHPSLSFEMSERGILLSVHVNPDYLEKMSVRFWTLEELREACKTGKLMGESLRPYFLPVIKTVCDEFT